MLSLLLASYCAACAVQENVVWLESLDLSNMTQDWGEPGKNRSVDGTPIMLHGKRYDHGVGTHATSTLSIRLYGTAKSFSSEVGVDDEKTGMGRIRFLV